MKKNNKNKNKILFSAPDGVFLNDGKKADEKIETASFFKQSKQKNLQNQNSMKLYF